MSHMTNESEDEMLSKDQSGLPLIDEGNCGGSADGSVVLKKGPWTSAEDAILVDYVRKHGEGNWNAVQKHSGLFRCGKSCRLRWANHLRPNLKKGAFTPEEERLIIELHAKMGNKWARMAAHLPGRTDNEIKNYWNTRIKRRQRAGLPLYPPEVSLQAMQESQQNQNASVDRGQNDLLQDNNFEIPDIIFDSLKDSQGALSYIPEIPCIPTSTMLLNAVCPSDYYGFVPAIAHLANCPRETASSFFGYNGSVRNQALQFEQPLGDSCGNITSQPVGSSFPYDDDPVTKNLLPFGETQGCHSLINGNFSASKPSTRDSKLELPSLQYPETDFSSWGSSSPPAMCESVDAFIQSPPHSGVPQSDCPSPKNSGLLDALLHEAKTRSSKNQLPQRSPNSSALVPDDATNCSVLDMSETKWEEYGDSLSPLDNSAPLIFSNLTTLSASGSSLEENPPAETFPGSNIKSEAKEQTWPVDEDSEENVKKLGRSRPDALLGLCWFGQGFACEKDEGTRADCISAPVHDDLGDDHELMVGSTAPNPVRGFGSCAWNNNARCLSDI